MGHTVGLVRFQELHYRKTGVEDKFSTFHPYCWIDIARLNVPASSRDAMRFFKHFFQLVSTYGRLHLSIVGRQTAEELDQPPDVQGRVSGKQPGVPFVLAPHASQGGVREIDIAEGMTPKLTPSLGMRR